MGLSTSTTIFLFIVCLCGGIAIGVMFSRIKKTPPQEAGESKEPVGEQPPVIPNLAQKGDVEILRAWRDAKDKPWLEMDGERLDGAAILKSHQKKKLSRMLADLGAWVGESLEKGSTPAPAPELPPAAAPAETSGRASLFAPRPREVVKPLLVKDEKPKVSLKSIVEQIDDVLQVKLEGTEFATQGIKLFEGPGGTVMVQIGNLKYEGVGSVPDPQIQALIQQAVAEWDKSIK